MLAPKPANWGLESRPYQERIVSKAVELFTARGLRSVLIDSPTGSGKTLMGLLIARALHEQLGVRVGWVAMRRFLLSQAASENERLGIRLPCEFVSMFDRDPPTNLDMLVVDEAQHDAAASMAHLHNLIRPRFILGLSATPFRSDGVKLCFDAVIRDAGIHQLIQDGYLSSFEHYTIPAYSPRHVVECYAREPDRWGKAILYFHTLQQCGAARELLGQRAIAADVVCGTSDREAQIDAFREGTLRVLINCLMLGEGFDCPDLETVFCRPSGRSVTVQACGRALRKCPQVPLKRIVQCQATRWPFVRTASAAIQYQSVENEWRSLTANPQVQDLSRRMMHLMARTTQELPKFLSQTGARQAGRPELQPPSGEPADVEAPGIGPRRSRRRRR